MALQLGALLEALLSAGSPSDKADKAAEELAGYESRFARIEADFNLEVDDGLQPRSDRCGSRKLLIP